MPDERRYLVTCEVLDDSKPEACKKVVERLKAFAKPPSLLLVRVVIQWDDDTGKMDDPADYKETFRRIKKVATPMLLCVDSEAAKNLTEKCYASHVEKCLTALGEFSPVVEVGNEINCDNWSKPGKKPGLGKHDMKAVLRMVRDACRACESKHLQTAITYFLDGDVEDGEEPEFKLATWLAHEAQIPCDYALISYYPNESSNLINMQDLKVHFKNLSQLPTKAIGRGEYSLKGEPKHQGFKTVKEIIRNVEKDCWTEFRDVPKYQGFGGFWDWATSEQADALLREFWAAD
jgi:hypothetical protein